MLQHRQHICIGMESRRVLWWCKFMPNLAINTFISGTSSQFPVAMVQDRVVKRFAFCTGTLLHGWMDGLVVDGAQPLPPMMKKVQPLPAVPQYGAARPPSLGPHRTGHNACPCPRPHDPAGGWRNASGHRDATPSVVVALMCPHADHCNPPKPPFHWQPPHPDRSPPPGDLNTVQNDASPQQEKL